MKRIRILAVLVLTVFLMTGCDALIELPEDVYKRQLVLCFTKIQAGEGTKVIWAMATYLLVNVCYAFRCV